MTTSAPARWPSSTRQAALLSPAAVPVGDDRDVVGWHRRSSRPSARLDLEDLLLLALEERVDLADRARRSCFCSSVSARCSSSEPASPSFFSSRRSCITSRRMLRTATRPSSATPWTTLTSSLRRSSVSSGICRRITLPSLEGVRPRSDSITAFSIAEIEDLSYGRHGQQAGVGRGHLRELLERRLGAVVVDDRGGRAGAARRGRCARWRARCGSHSTDFPIRSLASASSSSISSLIRCPPSGAGSVAGLLDTSVPTRSPLTILSMLRSSAMLKT